MQRRDDSRSVVRRGPEIADATRPLVTPIFPATAYVAESPAALDAVYEGRARGFTYAREGHPNAAVLADKLDWLEGAQGGVITGSGMGAVATALLGALSDGDHVVGAAQLYGRSLRLMRQELPRLGYSVSLADASDARAIEAALRPETRVILVETVSNPTLRVADIAAIAEIARREEVLLAVDNTFATPRGFRPFEHGADIVIHSVTKLLAGHSDATLGYVAAHDGELGQALHETAVTWGLTPSPMDCWLAERGLHSFALRFDRAQENAAELADFLAGLGGVARVIYPGRPDHPDHARAARLLGSNFGTMLAFEVGGGRAAAEALVGAAPAIPFAPTLGDVATTLSHPASSSHRGLRPAERRVLGIGDGLFRVSVGIEDIDMLKAEFETAIAAAAEAAERTQATG